MDAPFPSLSATIYCEILSQGTVKKKRKKKLKRLFFCASDSGVAEGKKKALTSAINLSPEVFQRSIGTRTRLG